MKSSFHQHWQLLGDLITYILFVDIMLFAYDIRHFLSKFQAKYQNYFIVLTRSLLASNLLLHIFSHLQILISNLINILSLREEGGSTSIKYLLSFRFYHKTTIFVIFWYIEVTNLELKHARVFMYTLLLFFFVIFFSCVSRNSAE